MDRERVQRTAESEGQTASVGSGTGKKNRRSCLMILGIAFLAITAVWFLVRPGAFTVQPIGALPEGVTFIYHSRNPELPFFSSPDGLCLKMQGSVSLLCRGVALGTVDDHTDRIIIRLPYSHWAYLQSTEGREFE